MKEKERKKKEKERKMKGKERKKKEKERKIKEKEREKAFEKDVVDTTLERICYVLEIFFIILSRGVKWMDLNGAKHNIHV